MRGNLTTALSVCMSMLQRMTFALRPAVKHACYVGVSCPCTQQGKSRKRTSRGGQPLNDSGRRVFFVELFAGSGNISSIAQRVLQLPAQRCVTIDKNPGERSLGHARLRQLCDAAHEQ